MFPLLSETLRRLTPLLPPELVAPRALPGLLAAAETLPVPFAAAALECRLGEGEPRIDLLVCLRADAGQRLASLHAGAGREWEGIRRFCSQWRGTDQEPLLWLELDFDGPASPPTPFGFLCLHAAVDAARPAWLREPAAATSPGVPRIVHSLSLLGGRPLAPAVAAALDGCVRRLPPDGALLHAAPLASRGSDAVRIVATLPADRLPGYLAAAGWPGTEATARELISLVAPDGQEVRFQLDVGPGVGPELGLEISFPENGPLEPPWRPLLAELASRGACSPAKMRAALAWPGQGPARDEGGIARLHRGMQIKLVHGPGRPLRAKVYLGFTHYFSLAGGP